MEELVPLTVRKRIASQRIHDSHFPVRYEQIEFPVVVVIEPQNAKSRIGQTGVAETIEPGDLIEHPLAVILKKRVGLLLEVRDQKVFVSVIIEVGRRDSHSRLCLPVCAAG